MFRRAFEIIFLFLFFAFYGCAKDHLVRRQESVANRKVLSLLSELSVKVFSRDDVAFSLNPQIKDIAFVRDSIKLEEFYVHGSQVEGDIVYILGAAIGFFGCIGGCNSADSYDCFYGNNEEAKKGCLKSCAYVLSAGAIIYQGRSRANEFIKALPGYIKIDTVCVDSMFLVKKKIKVAVEKSDFQKIYYTDEDGNITLQFNDVVPKLSEADSVLSLIIQYEELVDTVEVKCLEKFSK